MSSKLKSLKQHITKLEAKNAEISKENTEICNLRIKLLVLMANDMVSKVLPEVITKSLEEKEMDNFLNEAYKKSISDKIRQRNKEKKFSETDSDNNILDEPKGNQLDYNLSFRKDLFEDGNFTVPFEQEQFSITAKKSYDKRINEIHIINKVKINTIKQQVYQEVKKLLPDILQITYSTNAILSLNNTQIQNIIDFMLITDLVEINISTTSITPSYDSNFSNNSSVISSDNSPIIPYDTCTPYINMTLKEYPYLSLYYNDECNDGYEFKSSGLCLECENEYSKGKYQSSSHEKKIMTPEIISSITHQANMNNPTYNHIYFHNKILNQYSNLYREFNSENFDYYGITDGISYPLCKLDHDDKEIHLALSCHKVPSDIKEKFLFMVKTRGESQTFQLEAAEVSSKKKIGHQQLIIKYSESNTIEPIKKQICDCTVVKFFICCEISFHLIEHPFFIDMVKSLYLEYDPSSANTLSSQDFLYEELANIVVDQHLELKRTKNLMLVITEVGAENFAAVVSDHASACIATKKELLNDTKYKHILPIRCITYHQSYQTGKELRSKITNEIKRDGLKTYVITRWTTAWDCTDSIL
ncbi:hypothetical protein RhiirC2_794294 [Rhizophagus irregularis]|uniref:Uncharacterized protein n=1 Tax=Rhizophagus irregularis TaxID=588596 RepID=A0A2N1MDU4_9GLOM|nr:hypothetical protein RhiirC2_794294 [Rhizophagus irregularis]